MDGYLKLGWRAMALEESLFVRHIKFLYWLHMSFF